MNNWVIKESAYEEDCSQKTLQEIYDYILTKGNNTDKGTTHSYIDSYAKLFEPYRHLSINLFEIGIDFGWGLSLWRKYFDKATIYGIDNRNVLQYNKDIHVVFDDANKIETVSKYYSNIEFDIIIDDASHEISTQCLRFPIYFSKLKSNGIYVIEDVQSIDNEGHLLTSLDKSAEIIDLRKIKNRYDDVMVIYRK